VTFEDELPVNDYQSSISHNNKALHTLGVIVKMSRVRCVESLFSKSVIGIDMVASDPRLIDVFAVSLESRSLQSVSGMNVRTPFSTTYPPDTLLSRTELPALLDWKSLLR